MLKEMYMEDVRDISIKVSDYLDELLREYDLTFNTSLEDKLDEIYISIFDQLSNICNNDYKHHI